MSRGGSWLPPHATTLQPATARSRPVWPSLPAPTASTACPPSRQPAGFGPAWHVAEPSLLGPLPRRVSAGGAVGVEHPLTRLDELPRSGLVAMLDIGDERRGVADQPGKRRDRQATSFPQPSELCPKASCCGTVGVKSTWGSAAAQAPARLPPNVAWHCSPPSDVVRRWTASRRTSCCPLQTARYG
jgi:hypothetical protein